MALQPSIVRIYKIAGLICLTAILIGLIGFLTVNIFYFFDKSWVRPIRLDDKNEKVVEASQRLADAKLRASQLATERLDIEAQLKEIDRTVATEEKFIADVTPKEPVKDKDGKPVDRLGGWPYGEPPKTPEQWLVRREVDKATLDRDNALGRRAPLEKRLENLKSRIDDQDKIIGRLMTSPYARAAEHPVVIAFVPYKNLQANVKVGTSLYSCSWGIVACSNAGKVTAILDGEVTDKHPHDESVQRGQFIEIEVSTSSSGDRVLFAGGKPLWLF